MWGIVTFGIVVLDKKDSVLKIEGLHVAFEMDNGTIEAVRDVSFEIGRGRVMALVGESGSGKSVTAFSIMRLIQKPGKITGGTITLIPEEKEPVEVNSLSAKDPRLFDLRGSLVSMIFQEPISALSPVHTIGDQICEAILTHRKMKKKEAEVLVIEMLEKVGIPEPQMRLRQYPHEFSGGMRQRIVIAMALVCRPELLIADEPTTALDVTIQAQILKLIKDLQDEMGTSVLFITHDMGVVAQMADDVAVMYKGRIVEMGTVRQLLKAPCHPYTRGLLAAIPGVGSSQERLPTISSVVGDIDIETPYPLRPGPDGRLVSLPPDEVEEMVDC
jgi:dipeptide transport system ATP-binding protein